MQTAVGVIPARFGSTRFPGKPLALINDRTLIERVYTAASKNKKLTDIIVATDHQEIFEHVKAFGGNVVMTSSDHQTGSDRVWEAVAEMNTNIIINIQGDEPLLDISWLDLLIDSFNDSSVQMSTLAKKITEPELNDKNTVKVILDNNSYAIYFSRFAIPFSRKVNDLEQVYKHIGLYGYRKSFLDEFCRHQQVNIELGESLEQLRALYMGANIKVSEVFAEAVGVDHPDDIARVEKILNERGMN